VVSPKEQGLRVSALLSGRGGLPVNVSQELLTSGRVRLNGRPVTTDVALAPRDEVFAHVLTRATPDSSFDTTRVLLSDAHVLVVDKPAGVPTQGTEADAQAGLDTLLRRWLVAKGEQQPLVSVVHRLDRDTSGVVVFGRSEEAVRSLNEQFRSGTVAKRYIALVSGHPTWDAIDEDGPIGADPDRSGSFRVSSQGRPALTHFQVLTRFGVAASGLVSSRLEARPATGRSHQIRVHAAALGHPLLGDSRYGGPTQLTGVNGERVNFDRVALHATELAFDHPAGGRRSVRAPRPPDFDDWERTLENRPKVP
jgi:RluA family pseudouridine synthase